MVNAGRTAAGWLAGRALLFVVALAVLVAADVARDDASWIRAQAVSLLPDARNVADLSRRRAEALEAAGGWRREANARLATAHELSTNELAHWLAALDREIAELESKRLEGLDLVLAAGDPGRLVEHTRSEARLQVLRWTRDELHRLAALRAVTLSPREAADRARSAKARHVQATRDYRAARERFERYAREHPLAATVPFEMFGLSSDDRAAYLDHRRDYVAAATRLRNEKRDRDRAEALLERLERAEPLLARPLEGLAPSVTEALDAVIESRQRSADAASRGLAELWRRAGQVATTAFWIVVGLTLLPVLLKAFWYYVMAPLAARRPPIRIAPGTTPTTSPVDAEPSAASRSAVSLDVRLGERDELLVHPEFLQSLATPGTKSTRWLLDPSYPLMSLASGMVALTCIRGAGQVYTVSSRKDPLAEVAAIDVPAGARFVLQPRRLVGVVQDPERPMRIASHWRLGLGAWITLQFRYLTFVGPGRLLVAGCRGVRREVAATGRSIDQAATIGFSGELDYLPRRSATFGAYLLGINGLFDDAFAGDGIYVYEEMPYHGRRSGLTGRGLEGVTDVLLQAFGI
jgi:hypothetical protein